MTSRVWLWSTCFVEAAPLRRVSSELGVSNLSLSKLGNRSTAKKLQPNMYLLNDF